MQLANVGSVSEQERDAFYQEIEQKLKSIGITQSFLDDIIRTIRLGGEPAPNYRNENFFIVPVTAFPFTGQQSDLVQ